MSIGQSDFDMNCQGNLGDIHQLIAPWLLHLVLWSKVCVCLIVLNYQAITCTNIDQSRMGSNVIDMRTISWLVLRPSYHQWYHGTISHYSQISSVGSMSCSVVGASFTFSSKPSSKIGVAYIVMCECRLDTNKYTIVIDIIIRLAFRDVNIIAPLTKLTNVYIWDQRPS